MPRTTIDLDATVLEGLRQRGRREHKSLGRVASELLARALEEPAPTGPGPLRWTSAALGEPAVDSFAG